MHDLLNELYIYIFILADDVNSTKVLRSVSKTAYSASYDYFNLVLREPIFIYHNYKWEISIKDPNIKELVEKRKHEDVPAWARFCHGGDSDTPNKAMIFKTNIKDLYKTFNHYKNDCGLLIK